MGAQPVPLLPNGGLGKRPGACPMVAVHPKVRRVGEHIGAPLLDGGDPPKEHHICRHGGWGRTGWSHGRKRDCWHRGCMGCSKRLKGEGRPWVLRPARGQTGPSHMSTGRGRQRKCIGQRVGSGRCPRSPRQPTRAHLKIRCLWGSDDGCRKDHTCRHQKLWGEGWCQLKTSGGCNPDNIRKCRVACSVRRWVEISSRCGRGV